MSRHLLLTGATGLVGQYLLRDLLARGIPTAVLTRGRQDESAESRIEGLLEQFEAHQGRRLARPVCLAGDIAQPRLGLSGKAWRWAADHCDRVLHNAASVSFHGPDRRRDPWLSNVIGTHNVLEFCRLAGVRQFHYMSTAYVCGKRPGPVLEDDPAGTCDFRNDYEHSKFEAEKLVRGASFLDRPTVYRPATIVGASRTGHTTTYHGLYFYFRFADVLRQNADLDDDGRFHIAFRYNVTGNELRNLVPVDWVSAATMSILLNARHHGRTYHLTPTRPVSVREIDEATSSYFRYYGHVFAGPNGLDGAELSDLERLFYGNMTEYEPYWTAEPIFDSRNTQAALGHLPCPVMDRQLLHRLIDFALNDRWGKRRARRPLAV